MLLVVRVVDIAAGTELSAVRKLRENVYDNLVEVFRHSFNQTVGRVPLARAVMESQINALKIASAQYAALGCCRRESESW
jgi:hypothetical protein